MKISFLILLTNIITIYSYIDNSYYVLFIASFIFNIFLITTMVLSHIYIKKENKEEIFKLIRSIDYESKLLKIYKFIFLIFSTLSFLISISFSFYFKEYFLATISTLSFLILLLNIKYLKKIKKEYKLIKEETKEGKEHV